MWHLVVAGLAGALAMGTRAPKTKFKKRELLGPVTGNFYSAEELPTSGILIIRAWGAEGLFERNESGQFIFTRGTGPEEALRAMKSDFDTSELEDDHVNTE